MLEKDKTIILTGGAGFIGSNTALALNQQGFENLIIVDHLNHESKEKRLELVKYEQYYDRGDFLGALPRLKNIAAIVHLGACTDTAMMDEKFMMENNTEYSKKLFDYAARNGLRFIYASSAATYGDGACGYSDKERNLKPLNPYGVSKYLFDEYVLNSPAKPAQWTGLKFFNVYGPGEAHKGKMASMIYQGYRQAKEHGDIMLFKFGEQKRDFIYVEDAVKIVLFFLNNEKSGIFNVGAGKARSFLDLGDAIFAALGRKPRIIFFDMPGKIKGKYQSFTEADMTSLRQAGYREKFYELKAGINDYIKELEKK